jgi:hypothetical protein
MTTGRSGPPSPVALTRASLVFVRAVSVVVPLAARREWLAEWEAEIAWHTGSPPVLASRCLGALPHALWLRREQWRWDMLGQDLRYAVRQLVGRPAFTLLATLTLALVGKTIRMGMREYVVAGIMPESFRFGARPVDIWAPLAYEPGEYRELRQPHFLRGIARLKPGVTIDRARVEMNAIASALEREFPRTNTKMGVGLGPLTDWFVGRLRLALLVTQQIVLNMGSTCGAENHR